MAKTPGITGRTKIRLRRRKAVGEFIRCSLAQHQCACFFEFPYGSAITRCDILVQWLRTTGCATTLVNIFDPDGDAVQCPAVMSGSNLRGGLLRRLQGMIGRQGEKGIQPRIESLTPFQVGLHDLYRRDLPGTNAIGKGI